jgi:hypothetical protein
MTNMTVSLKVMQTIITIVNEASGLRRQESTGHNSGFKKWRLTSKIKSMCNKFTFVSGGGSEVFQTSPLLKPANRSRQYENKIGK